MKIVDIALKDLKRSFRTPFVLVMMFGAPLLITGLLYFAFGNLTSDGDDFDLPVIRVQVANLDQPEAQAGGLVAGETLVESVIPRSLIAFHRFHSGTPLIPDCDATSTITWL